MAPVKVLGIEGGATKTTWTLFLAGAPSQEPSLVKSSAPAAGSTRLLKELESGTVGPANMQLKTDGQLVEELQKLPKEVGQSSVPTFRLYEYENGRLPLSTYLVTNNEPRFFFEVCRSLLGGAKSFQTSML
jgi:hypothetical protein